MGLSILISSAVASGILLGVIYLNFFYRLPTDYGKYSQNGLRDDEAAIMAQYSNSDITTLTGTNAFIIAEHKSRQQRTVTINADGMIDAAGVKQSLYTTRYLDYEREIYYVENISKGANIMGINTNIAERNYYDTQSGMVSVYQGSNIRERSADFEMDNPNQTVTLADWENTNGTTPISFQPYIVSTQTVLDATTPVACVLDDGSHGFSFRLRLNHKAAFLYVKQMKNLSKLADYPSFDYINLEVFLNEDGTFNKITTDEKYYVKMAINVGTLSKLTYHFTYNDDIMFPYLDTKEREWKNSWAVRRFIFALRW